MRKKSRVRALEEAPEAKCLRLGLPAASPSGKSAVGEMFAALGAHVIQADEISHQLMQPGQAVYREVVRSLRALKS